MSAVSIAVVAWVGIGVLVAVLWAVACITARYRHRSRYRLRRGHRYGHRRRRAEGRNGGWIWAKASVDPPKAVRDRP